MNNNITEYNFIAFKEWEGVIQAIAKGLQSVILRKGGISEGKKGFEWKYDSFFLLPTNYHEDSTSFKENKHIKNKLKLASEESKNTSYVYIKKYKSKYITDIDELKSLSPFHVLKENIIENRFQWTENNGIFCAFIQEAYILKSLNYLYLNETFKGCKSWFEIKKGTSNWKDSITEITKVDIQNSNLSI